MCTLSRHPAPPRLWLRRLTAVGAVLPLGLAACQQRMAQEGRIRPYAASSFFPDGHVARPLVAGTVARQHGSATSSFATGMIQGRAIDSFPFPITESVLVRGQERFMIYCSPCHGRLGDGKGMIVQRGFQPPPTFHQDRLRQAAPGHYVNVIAYGFGAMYPYAGRVAPSDRWAIAAYIKALQQSQNATASDLSPDQVRSLAGGAP